MTDRRHLTDSRLPGLEAQSEAEMLSRRDEVLGVIRS